MVVANANKIAQTVVKKTVAQALPKKKDTESAGTSTNKSEFVPATKATKAASSVKMDAAALVRKGLAKTGVPWNMKRSAVIAALRSKDPRVRLVALKFLSSPKMIGYLARKDRYLKKLVRTIARRTTIKNPAMMIARFAENKSAVALMKAVRKQRTADRNTPAAKKKRAAIKRRLKLRAKKCASWQSRIKRVFKEEYDRKKLGCISDGCRNTARRKTISVVKETFFGGQPSGCKRPNFQKNTIR